MYSLENGEIVMKHHNLREEPVDLYKHLRDSYQDYITSQGIDDGYYFMNTFQEKAHLKFENCSCWTETDTKGYNIKMKWSMAQEFSHEMDELEYTLISIPKLSENGVINIGRERVIQNILVKAEELTFTQQGATKLQCAKTSLQFRPSSDGRRIDFCPPGKRPKVTLAELAIYIGCLKGDLDPSSTITSDEGIKYLEERYSSKLMSLMANKLQGKFISTIYKYVNDSIGFLRLTEVQLGRARQTLNEKFSYDSVIGCTLAEEVDGFEAGTVLTKSVIDKITSDTIFIKYQPQVEGLCIAHTIDNYTIPAGTPINDYLLSKCPEFEDMDYIPYDTELELGLKAGTYIDKDLSQLLFFLNNEAIDVCFSKTQVGNTISIPCKKDVKRVSSSAKYSDTLTLDDIECLISFLCGCYELPDTFFSHKEDLDFSKVIQTFSLSVSSYLRQIIDVQLSRFMSSTIGALKSDRNHMSSSNGGLQNCLDKMAYKLWSKLGQDRVLEDIKYQNPNLFSYNSRVVTTIIKEHEAADSMRAILMGHFSRLCPFDTPSGKKIGLTNSLALRCKVDKGIAYAPYHKIRFSGNTGCVDKEVVWLTAQDESEYKIASIVDLKMDNPSPCKSIYQTSILNTPIPAKVPLKTKSSEENVTIETIMANELDYVTVYDDQVISQTLALIPFLGADDGPRAQFGGSMLRQSVPIIESEKPYVYTSLYKDLVEQTGWAIRAEENGIINNINNYVCTVKYDSGTVKSYPIAPKMKSSWMILYNPKFQIGESFQQGDVIIDTMQSRDGYYTPGRNVMIAYTPYYGWNFDDAIGMSEECATHFDSPIMSEITLELYKQSVNRWKVTQSSEGNFVREGQIIATVSSKNVNVDNKQIKATLSKSGLVRKISTYHDVMKDTFTVTVTLLKVEKPQVGDKYAGRHGNKGVDAKIIPNSEMLHFANGVPIEVIQNPCGIGSRMNPGQLLEAKLGFCCYLLDVHIRSNSFNGATIDEIHELLKFCHAVCNTSSPAEFEHALSKFNNIPDFIKDKARLRMTELQSWANCFNENGSAILYNGKTGKPIYYPVDIGNVYYLKLEHEVEHKRNERGCLNNDYCQVSKQPTKGTNKHGGQTIGEMELWALMAHGAGATIEEALNDKSDNVYIRKQIEDASATHNYVKDVDYEQTSNQGIETLRYYLECVGAGFDTDIGSDISLEGLLERTNNTQNNDNVNADSLFDM